VKRLKKVQVKWTPNFAYAIGLITSDGNLSPDGRHLNLTSKDREIVVMFKDCLGIGIDVSKADLAVVGITANTPYFKRVSNDSKAIKSFIQVRLDMVNNFLNLFVHHASFSF